jgi:hypothetical protein
MRADGGFRGIGPLEAAACPEIARRLGLRIDVAALRGSLAVTVSLPAV